MLCFAVLLVLFVNVTTFSNIGKYTGILERLDDANVNDPDVQAVAQEAMVQLNGQLKDKTLYKLVKVLKAQTQVVDGLKYHLTILSAPTKCEESSRNSDPTNCDADNTKPQKQFKVEVLTRPWEDFTQVQLKS
nr:cysteine protease inhibitor [Parabronema skrjabini]